MKRHQVESISDTELTTMWQNCLEEGAIGEGNYLVVPSFSFLENTNLDQLVSEFYMAYLQGVFGSDYHAFLAGVERILESELTKAEIPAALQRYRKYFVNQDHRMIPDPEFSEFLIDAFNYAHKGIKNRFQQALQPLNEYLLQRPTLEQLRESQAQLNSQFQSQSVRDLYQFGEEQMDKAAALQRQIKTRHTAERLQEVSTHNIREEISESTKKTLRRTSVFSLFAKTLLEKYFSLKEDLDHVLKEEEKLAEEINLARAIPNKTNRYALLHIYTSQQAALFQKLYELAVRIQEQQDLLLEKSKVLLADEDFQAFQLKYRKDLKPFIKMAHIIEGLPDELIPEKSLIREALKRIS